MEREEVCSTTECITIVEKAIALHRQSKGVYSHTQHHVRIQLDTLSPHTCKHIQIDTYLCTHSHTERDRHTEKHQYTHTHTYVHAHTLTSLVATQLTRMKLVSATYLYTNNMRRAIPPREVLLLRIFRQRALNGRGIQ